ncbi:hypothetical protein B0H10DRAFT_2383360 [Mycena sp. CBHHK59/15]|nr:hypothetical protein B0H10DRAFT_2383360 [Mycena sp. CBHHK59/15]
MNREPHKVKALGREKAELCRIRSRSEITCLHGGSGTQEELCDDGNSAKDHKTDAKENVKPPYSPTPNKNLRLKHGLNHCVLLPGQSADNHAPNKRAKIESAVPWDLEEAKAKVKALWLASSMADARILALEKTVKALQSSNMELQRTITNEIHFVQEFFGERLTSVLKRGIGVEHGLCAVPVAPVRRVADPFRRAPEIFFDGMATGRFERATAVEMTAMTATGRHDGKTVLEVGLTGNQRRQSARISPSSARTFCTNAFWTLSTPSDPKQTSSQATTTVSIEHFHPYGMKKTNNIEL